VNCDTSKRGDLKTLGSTDERAPKGFAPLTIGLALTLIHLISISVTNTSVNPARSTGPAPFVGDWALGQLWLFWLAPILGALVAGAAYRWLAAAEGSSAALPASAAGGAARSRAGASD
jgi:aquaporin Z